jgi:hypothetical protein
MFIFLFFVLFPLILSKDKPLATLKITDGSYTLQQFQMEMYDKYLPQDNTIDINVSAKVVYVSSIYRLFYVINRYQGYYNSRWVCKLNNRLI